MKPPVFAYAAPQSLSECLALLREHGDDARIIAGGQSLMPLLAMRMVCPSVVIDLGRIQALTGWNSDDGAVHVAAMVRQRALERDAGLAAVAPLLARAVAFIGHPATRSRGTVVGSLCHADPAAELPVCACLLGAEVVAVSSAGERRIPAADFYRGALSTALKDDELARGVEFPLPAPRGGFALRELSRRHGDFALVAAAARVELDEGALFVRADVALGGVAEAPVRFTLPELIGHAADASGLFEEASRRIAAAIDPQSDLHATAAYRRQVAAVLVKEVLAEAAHDACEVIPT